MAGEVISESRNSTGTMAALLLSAVLAVAFGASGYWVGLQPLALTLRAAVEVRDWQPVQARVLSAQIERYQDSDGTTWRVQARYRYVFAGRSYESTRVGLDPTGRADNIGDWHQRWQRRLQSAHTTGQSVVVRVNPHNPSQSLLDAGIRWQLLALRLPFALVFTGVGLVAAWVFFRILWGLLRPGGQAGPEDSNGAEPGRAGAGQGTAAHSVGAVWLLCFFWCGIAFPMAGILWSTDRSPWFAKAFVGLFVAGGLGLLAYALRQTCLAWRYAGAYLIAQPHRPRAGQPVAVALLLPARAAACQQGRVLQLRLAQYRVDESSSGSPERRVESFTEPAQVQPTADGGVRLLARFELPGDAPPHGAQRSGERVDWRVELLHGPGGGVQLTYDIPVQAAAHGFDRGQSPQHDRFDRRSAWQQVTPIEPPGDAVTKQDSALLLPHAVTLNETPQALHFTFSQTGWRWAAGLVLAGLALEAAIHPRLGARGVGLPEGFLAASAWWALVTFALHAATCRWVLSLQDDGITVRRHSWLWSRTETLPGQSSQALVHKLVFSTGSGDSENRYYAVYARGADDSLVRLTPGLRGDGGATVLGQSLAQAWAQRRECFRPGGRRGENAGYAWRPAWGVLLLLAAALAGSTWGAWSPRTAESGTSGTSGTSQGVTPCAAYPAVMAA